MKILSCILLLVASSAFVLMGCSDRVSAPVYPTNDISVANLPTPALAKEGIVHSVTGSANAYMIVDPVTGWLLNGPKQKGGYYQVITVNAIDHGDGTFSGRVVSQFQGKWPKEQTYGFYGKVEAKVIRLAVERNKALVVAEITNWIGPPGWPEEPWWMACVFIDNGEGGSAGSPDVTGAVWATGTPDEQSLWLTQSPQNYLDWTMTFIAPYGPTFPVDNGNIQVH